jgi:hypothetical protein
MPGGDERIKPRARIPQRAVPVLWHDNQVYADCVDLSGLEYALNIYAASNIRVAPKATSGGTTKRPTYRFDPIPASRNNASA